MNGLVDTETLTATGSAANLSSKNAGSYTTTVRYKLSTNNYSLAQDTTVRANIVTPSDENMASLKIADVIASTPEFSLNMFDNDGTSIKQLVEILPSSTGQSNEEEGLSLNGFDEDESG